MKYIVEVTIYNSYEIEAETQEEAEQLARELDCHETLKDCDFNVTHSEQARCLNIKIKQNPNQTYCVFVDGRVESNHWRTKEKAESHAQGLTKVKGGEG